MMPPAMLSRSLRLAVLAVALLPAAAGAGRLAHLPLWDDGLAEVAIYKARGERYGQPRDYRVEAVLVKEPFDVERGVKALEGSGVEVLKSNTLLTMRTGVYDYRQMGSWFLRRSRLEPLKLAITSQEWCGTTFKEWHAGDGAARLRTHSYFEGEGERDFALPADPGLVFLDVLPIVLRDDPTPRRLRVVSWLISSRGSEPLVEDARVLPARRVNIELAGKARPADQIEVEHGASRERLWLAAEPPFTLLSWERGDGHVWTLTDTRRLAYWTLTRPGDERAIDAPSTPPVADR